VVRLLTEFDVGYRSRYVEPMHSERNVVKRVSGARSVPAIVDRETGVTMSESANIVEYLKKTYGDAATDGGRAVDDAADDGDRADAEGGA